MDVIKNMFKKKKHVRFAEKNNEVYEIDYEYDRSREKMSLKPRSELIKALIEINEVKNMAPVHKDSVKNVSFKDVNLNVYMKYYDQIDDEFKREYSIY